MKNGKNALKAEGQETAPHLFCQECKVTTRHRYGGFYTWYCPECGTISNHKSLPK